MTFYKKFYAYLVGIIGSVLCLAASTIVFADAATATTAHGAIFFVVSRILYVAFYVADKSSLRSLAWLAGLITTLTIFASGSS